MSLRMFTEACRVPKGFKPRGKIRPRPAVKPKGQTKPSKIKPGLGTVDHLWSPDLMNRFSDKLKAKTALVSGGLFLIGLIIIARIKWGSRPSRIMKRYVRPARQRLKSAKKGTTATEHIDQNPGKSNRPRTPNRHKLLGAVKRTATAIEIGHLGLLVTTPEEVLYTKKHLHCPDHGYFGSCKDLCFHQYGSLDLATILYRQALVNIITVGFLGRSGKRTIILALLCLLGTRTWALWRLVTLIHTRVNGSSWSALFGSNYISSPYFNCDPTQTLQTEDKNWQLYYESCKYQEPQCKIDRPEMQSNHLRIHFFAITLSLVIYLGFTLRQSLSIRHSLCRSAERG